MILKPTFKRSPHTGRDYHLIGNSCNFRSSGAYIRRQIGAGGNRRKALIGAWVRKIHWGSDAPESNYIFYAASTTGTTPNNDNDRFNFFFNTSDRLAIGGAVTIWRETSRIFRDGSGWQFVLLAIDSTQPNAADRMRIYVAPPGGALEEVTDMKTNNAVPLNHDFAFGNNNYYQGFGNGSNNWNLWRGVNLAQAFIQDGQAINALSDYVTEFGAPKNLSGLNVGTQGGLYEFANASALGEATVGNDMGTVGGAPIQLTDSPTKNTARLNMADSGVQGNVRLYGARFKKGPTTGSEFARTTFPMFPDTGKWYNRVQITTDTNANGCTGIATFRARNSDGPPVEPGCYGILTRNSWKYTNGGGSVTHSDFSVVPGSSYVHHCYDTDTGEYWIGYSTTATGTVTWLGLGDPTTGTTPSWSGFDEPMSFFSGFDAGTSQTVEHNWDFDGDHAGTTDMPAGIEDAGYRWTTSENLEAPEELPQDHVKIIPYTGTGVNPQVITGVGFQSASIIFKSFDQPTKWRWLDAVTGGLEGVADKEYTSVDDGIQGNAGCIGVTTQADGFSLLGTADPNILNYKYSALCLRADTSLSGSTAGSGTSKTFTARKGIAWTITEYEGNGVAGHKIPHNGDKTPKLVFIKNLDGVFDWKVWCPFLTNVSNVLELNQNQAEISDPASFNSTAPDATHVTLGTGGGTNANGDRYVMYVFWDYPGICNIVEYMGTDGTVGGAPTSPLQHYPIWWMYEAINVIGRWIVHDENYALDDVNSYSDEYLSWNGATALSPWTSTFNADGHAMSTKHYSNTTAGNQHPARYFTLAFGGNPFACTNKTIPSAR